MWLRCYQYIFVDLDLYIFFLSSCYHHYFIIHTNQTSLMEHRSIMDNVILFWEVVATTRETKQNLACLMLDFEKAYDQVQWSFLKEVMKVIELPWEWRCVAQALYRNGSSKVLIVGRK